MPWYQVPGTITSFYRYILDLRQDVLYQVPGTGVHRLFYGSGHNILIRNDVHTFSGDRYGDNIITIETLAFKGLPGPWYRTLLNFAWVMIKLPGALVGTPNILSSIAFALSFHKTEPQCSCS